MPKRIPTFRPSWLPKRSTDAVRPNSTQRGYGSSAWQRTRLLVIARDGGICQHCGLLVPPHGGEAHIDHIKEKALGGSDALENLRLLCRSCHSRRHARGVEPSG